MRKSETLSDIILSSLLVISSLECLATGLKIPCHPAFIPIAIVLSAMFCLLWNGKRRSLPFWIGIPAVIASSVISSDSLKYLFYRIVSFYSKGYYFFYDLMPEDRSDFPIESEAESYLLKAFIFLAVLFCFITTMCLRRLKKTIPAAVLLSFGITPCLVLTDTIPHIIPLAVFAVSFLTLIFSSPARRTGSVNYVRSVIFTGLASTLLSTAVFMIFPQDAFDEQMVSFKEFTIKAVNTDFNIPDEIKNRFKRHIKETSIDLNDLTDLPDDKSVVMTLRTTCHEAIYLRGSAYSDFDGRNWMNTSFYDNDPYAFSPAFRSENDDYVEITTTAVENVIYTPYYIAGPDYLAMVENDSFMSNSNGLSQYSFKFNDAYSKPEYSADYVNSLGNYSEWVYSHCLYLPEETKQAVLSWLYEQDTAFLSLSDPYLTAARIAELVSQTTEYSRSPSPVDKSKDFCEWFLRDAEKGYCSHYATVTAATLRAMGIPARYASGYIVNADRNIEKTVTGMQAHAWVEAWIEDKWIVIEATPESSVVGSINTASATSTPAPSVSPSPAPSDTPVPESTVTPEATETPESTPELTKAPATDLSEETGSIAPVLITIAAIVLIILILPARRLILITVRKNKMKKADINTRARLAYRQAKKLKRYTKTPVPVKVRDAARKAAFSNRRLTDDELKVILEHIKQEKKKLEDSKFLKRLFYKYILVLI